MKMSMGLTRSAWPLRFSALATAMMLSACTVGPDYAQPGASASQHYDQSAEQAFDMGQKIQGDWWSTLRSPALDHVMRRAISGNLKLAAADATLRQAAASVAAAEGALYPQLDLGATAGRQRTHNQPQPSVANVYAIGPRVAFDLDAFGGNQRAVEQQQAGAALQRHRYEAAYLTLTGDVARQALLLASANAQIEAVESLLANDAKNLDMVQTAQHSGGATRIDVALAQTRLAQDRTLLPPLAQQRDAARHALSILAGTGPADRVAPGFTLDAFTLPDRIPVSLPSEMARTRPDILQADAELHAASAAVGVATANLYPRVELSASLMQAASGNGGAALWGFAAGLSAPIFNGGTLKAERLAAVEGYNAALARYRQTLIESFGQVADSLQAINHGAEQNLAQDQALQAADTSLRLNRQAYAQGQTSTLQVLEAERAYQQALLGQIRVKTARYLDTVQLFLALGGNAVGVSAQNLATRGTAQPPL